MEGVIEVVISFTSWMISEKLAEYSWIYKDMVHINEDTCEEISSSLNC